LSSCLAPGPDRRATKEDDVLSQLHDAVRDPTASEAPVTRASTKTAGGDLLTHILTSLEDDKAEDVVKIGLRGKSEMADHMVICSGRSSRQVTAIAEKLVDRLKQETGVLCKVEGKETGDWVLIDAGDVIVHVFRPEVRDFYQLEKMWMSPAEAAAKA
jgi:ribosome-associated protein